MGNGMSYSNKSFEEGDVESAGSRRTRFVDDGLYGREEKGGLHYATIHVGFLRNENKGTTKNHFIPPEYHQMMAQMEDHMRQHEGETGMSHADPAGSDSLTFNQNSQYHKARERYRKFTRSGAGPFSWVYNRGRDFIAGNMMKNWTYKHCEIAFDQSMFTRAELYPVNGIPYGPDCLVAFGTNMKDGEIFKKPRTFKPRGSRYGDEEPYEWIHLRLPTDTVHRVIDLSNQEVGKEYDTKTLERMLTSPAALKPSSQWEAQKWHCTNFTVHILQQAGFLNGLDPNCLTADDVYYYLKDNGHETRMFVTPATEGKNAQRIRLELEKVYSEY